MRHATRPLLAAFFGILATAAVAGEVVDKYHITPEEKAACQEDAVNLCSDVPQDEDSLIACMKLNAAKLTPVCLKAFKAGLVKRHIPLPPSYSVAR